MLTRFHHFVQAVRDIEAATEAYCRLFDLGKIEIGMDPRGFRIVILPLGESVHMLVQSVSPDGDHIKFIQRKGEGIYNVSIVEDDLDAKVKSLQARGFQLIPGYPPSGIVYYFLHPKVTRGIFYELYPNVQEAQPAPRPGWVKRITHFGHALWSIEAALPMYADLLGLRPGPEGIRTLPEARIKNVMLPLPTGENIELLEPTDPQSAINQFLERKGEGLYHLSLAVDNLGAALKKLQAKGARIISGEVAGTAWIHPKDTHGVFIELHE